MPLFSTCSQCGRKILYLELDECGICRDCRKENALAAVSREEMPPSREVDVSQLVKHESADYEPTEAPDGPVSVFIDVETTGLDPHQDAIIQVSAIRFFGDKGVDGLNTYINPLRPIPVRSMQVHGITDETVRDAPVIADIKDQFMALIKGAVLVGYNVTFDLNFLNNAFDGALDGVPYVDVLAAAKNILDLPNYRLETVATRLGFRPEGGFHDSLSDCMATAAVFFRLGLQGLLESPRIFIPSRPSSINRKRRPAYNTCTPQKTIQPVIPVDTSHPLFGKTIVFTGELSISRDDASQIAENVGAIVRGSVSCKTEYLVVGRQDKSIVGADGMSSKEEKAYALNESGKTHIEIINESQFLALINGGKKNGTDNP